jgi:hypothetical protein
MEVRFEAAGTGLPHEHFKLQGQGRTAEERRCSMQQQLAVMQASSSFLAPASWSSTHCLTSLCLDMGSARHDASYLEAAMQAPSLVELRVHSAEAGTTAAILPSVSRLTNLTQLVIDTMEENPPRKPPILDAIAHISCLQSLTMDEWLLGDVVDGDSAQVPPSWAGLTALTTMSLHFACPDLPSLAQLRSLRHLDLYDSPTAFGSIASLLPLTRLTSLIGPDDVYTGAEDEEEEVGEGTAVVVPQQWKEGLQRLEWPTSSGVTLGVVSQLTALSQLGLHQVCASFETCRCELGSLLMCCQQQYMLSESSFWRWQCDRVPAGQFHHSCKCSSCTLKQPLQ